MNIYYQMQTAIRDIGQQFFIHSNHYYHKYKDLSYLQWLFNQTNINMALKFIDEDENMNLRYRDGISLQDGL